ncbi:MAG: ATP-binding protein [Saprospiraceae bacterium]
MIDFFNSLPFRRKLILINIAIILPMIIVGTIISISVVERNGKRAVENQVAAFSDLTASFVVPNLLFNDRNALKEDLNNFEALPDVTYAAILDAENQVIASYKTIKEEVSSLYLANKTNRFENESLIHYKAIEYKNENLGTLFIVNNTDNLQQLLKNIYTGIVIASAIAFILLIATSSWIQKIITRPIIKLVKIIEVVVKTRNYGERIKNNPYGDEIGVLYNNFNKMLETIDTTTVSKNYLDNVMGSLAEMVIVLNEDSEIYTINEAVTRLTSFTIDDLQNKLPTVLLADFQEISDENPILKYETTLQTQNQKKIFVSVSVTTFVNNENQKRIILSIRDITQRKAAEKELNANFSKLERTNKELQELSYILSHDLKAPVRGIGSLVTMMREDFEADDLPKDMITDYFRLIQKRIHRMNSLINGILEFSKIGRQDIQIKEVNLQELVTEVVDTVVPDTFEVNLPNELPSITFNQTQAYQIFQNLIGNAVKYNDKAVGKIDVYWKDLGDKHQFRIKDNGIGIDEKYHNKIFKVFQMLESRDTIESTGIGLAIVKKIIDKANGKIWIDSNYDIGVAFVFELPK